MSAEKLDRIRKLLAQAEDPAATPEEAEAFNAKATRLIAEYGIDRALLNADKPGTDEMITKKINFDAPYARDKADLLWAVSRPLRVEGIRHRKAAITGGYWFSMTLIGWRSDVERCELLYTSLLLQAATEMNRQEIPWFENSASYRRAWLHGFSVTIEQRLHAAEARARQRTESSQSAPGTSSGPSVALVLADRSVAVKQEVKRQFPGVKETAPRNLSGGGMCDGALAGRRADIGTTRVGQQASKLIGAAR